MHSNEITCVISNFNSCNRALCFKSIQHKYRVLAFVLLSTCTNVCVLLMSESFIYAYKELRSSVNIFRTIFIMTINSNRLSSLALFLVRIMHL